MSILLKKVKEVLFSVMPIVIFVLLLHFTLTPLPGVLLFRFIAGSLVIVLGLSILLFGIDLGVFPLGSHMGESFLKSNKIWYIVVVGLVLGFFVNAAEPDLQILASQVASVTGGYISMFTILIIVSMGAGIMLSLGIIRIAFRISLLKVFAVAYGVILLLAVFSSSDMMAIAFDASGATTGALTVPLVLALSVGVAAMKRDSKASEADSFGLVGIMSTGAILAVLLLNLFVKTDHISGMLELHPMDSNSLLGPFITEIPKVAMEALVALLPMVLILIIFQKITFHMKPKSFRKTIRGFLYAYIGLVLFLVGVHAGFMDVGSRVGRSLALRENGALLVCFGFVLGMLVILTEPAVYVLTKQIESVTSGYIKRKTVLVTLAIGVAFAVSLAMLRIVVPEIMLWHYLLPGYVISLSLMSFVPSIFVGIAFDSGGVASGPMTTTFVLAFAQGASSAVEHADVLTESFGMIAMVAMTPLIALQVLGLIYKIKSKKVEV